MDRKEYQKNYRSKNRERLLAYWKEYYLNHGGKDRVRRALVRAKTRNRATILMYLSTHPCVDCGEQDMRCLDFDHVRGVKSKCVTAMNTASTKRLLQEISKCDIRCANCHRKRHSLLTDTYSATYNTV